MTVDSTTTNSTATDSTATDPTTTDPTVAKPVETGDEKINIPIAARPKQNLTALVVQSLRQEGPSQENLPDTGQLTTGAPEKLLSAEVSPLLKRGRRRHRRQVFKPKRRGRPRHMLPGGSR